MPGSQEGICEECTGKTVPYSRFVREVLQPNGRVTIYSVCTHCGLRQVVTIRHDEVKTNGDRAYRREKRTWGKYHESSKMHHKKVL